MVRQEIDINEYLESVGIAVWETDLPELIVQLGQDMPCCIPVSAIHRITSEVREIFAAAHPGGVAAHQRPRGVVLRNVDIDLRIWIKTGQLSQLSHAKWAAVDTRHLVCL